MKNKRLLIITKEQYGYHTDTYKYVQLIQNYKVTYLCIDNGYEKLIDSKCDVKYCSYSKSSLFSNIIFFFQIFKKMIQKKYDIVFFVYFPLCSIFPFFLGKNHFLLDVRTSTIHKSERIRSLKNNLMKFEIKCFRYISIISESLKDYLKITNENTSILPLGSSIISNTNKCFDKINLIYVGIFSFREIEKTIFAISELFLERPEMENTLEYYIIGYGYNNEEKFYHEIINDLKLTKQVHLIGKIAHNQLQEYFNKCNVGVAFIPITEYFNYQPPTKTFEYLLSGMPCIATDTYENRKIINKENGVLIKDSIEGFKNGILKILDTKYNSEHIRTEQFKNTWEYIVNEKLMPILDQVL